MTLDEGRRSSIKKHFPYVVYLVCWRNDGYDYLEDKFGSRAYWLPSKIITELRFIHPEALWEIYSDDHDDGTYFFFKEEYHAVEFKLMFG